MRRPTTRRPAFNTTNPMPTTREAAFVIENPPPGRPTPIDQKFDALLVTTLQFAIPMWVFEMQRIPLADLMKQAPELAQTIAEKGDVIQFRSKKKGETAHAFNSLAKALAILSFSPGGVTFCGLHFENKHPDAASI